MKHVGTRGSPQDVASQEQVGAVPLTAAALAALAGSAGLVVNRIYRLTDTKQMAIAASASAYDLWSRAGEQGVVVSATAPATPYLNQIWLRIPTT